MVIRRNYIKALKRVSGIATLALAQCVMTYSYSPQGRSVELGEVTKDRFFKVQGAVSRPGVYQFRQEASLVKLLAMAGGLTQGHGSFVYVFRAIRNQSELKVDGESYVYAPGFPAAEKQNLGEVDGVGYDLLRVHTNGIFKNEFSQSLSFPSGSIFNVPNGAVVFVIGDVRTPGSFRYQVGTTLRQAILLAHRESIEAASYAVIYRVHPETCIEREMIIDLDSLGNAEGNDIDIHPDDIVNVYSRGLCCQPLIRLSHLLNSSHD